MSKAFFALIAFALIFASPVLYLMEIPYVCAFSAIAGWVILIALASGIKEKNNEQ